MENKQALLLELLSTGKIADLYVRTRHDGVQIPGLCLPPHVMAKDWVRLQVGYNMGVPIADLTVDGFRVSGTFSFNRTPTWTQIPWDSVFAIAMEGDPRGQLWGPQAPESFMTALAANGIAAKPPLPNPSVMPPVHKNMPCKAAPVAEAVISGQAKVYNLAEYRAKRAQA